MAVVFVVLKPGRTKKVEILSEIHSQISTAISIVLECEQLQLFYWGSLAKTKSAAG